MVIAKLYGGLGNQMYQYAAGLALSKRLSSHLFLDLSWFEEVKHQSELTNRNYELDQLGIHPNEIGWPQTVMLKLSPAVLFQEKSFAYDSQFEHLSGNVLLDGYWQSYKYFSSYKEDILDAFQFAGKMKVANRKLIQSASTSNSVAIHVRRGDYNTIKGKKFHGLLPISYYVEAVAGISQRVKNPSLLIFSDDIAWCKKKLKFELPTTYVDSNGLDNGAEDMQIMLSCKNFIIANSSFSWWAAWLSSSKDKVVYAPLAWFKGVDFNAGDRIPSDWKLI